MTSIRLHQCLYKEDDDLITPMNFNLKRWQIYGKSDNTCVNKIVSMLSENKNEKNSFPMKNSFFTPQYVAFIASQKAMPRRWEKQVASTDSRCL